MGDEKLFQKVLEECSKKVDEINIDRQANLMDQLTLTQFQNLAREDLSQLEPISSTFVELMNYKIELLQQKIIAQKSLITVPAQLSNFIDVLDASIARSSDTTSKLRQRDFASFTKATLVELGTSQSKSGSCFPDKSDVVEKFREPVSEEPTYSSHVNVVDSNRAENRSKTTFSAPIDVSKSIKLTEPVFTSTIGKRINQLDRERKENEFTIPKLQGAQIHRMEEANSNREDILESSIIENLDVSTFPEANVATRLKFDDDDDSTEGCPSKNPVSEDPKHNVFSPVPRVMPSSAARIVQPSSSAKKGPPVFTSNFGKTLND